MHYDSSSIMDPDPVPLDFSRLDPDPGEPN
jgi:hypothetical protein